MSGKRRPHERATPALTLAACAALAVGGAPGQATPLAAQVPPGPSCYDVDVGRWSQPLGVDSIYDAPPPRVLVDTARGRFVPPGARSVRPAPGVTPSVHRFAFLAPAGQDLRLTFSTGFVGVTGTVRGSGGTLRGTLTHFDDTPQEGEVHPEALVTLTPVACDAPFPDAWRPMAHYPTGIALAGGDSIRLGAPLPEGLPILEERGNAVVLDVRPAGLFAASNRVAVRRDEEGRVGYIQLGLPAAADPAGLEAVFTEAYGPPTGRGDFVAWADRMSNFSLLFSATNTTVVIRDPRFR